MNFVGYPLQLTNTSMILLRLHLQFILSTRNDVDNCTFCSCSLYNFPLISSPKKSSIINVGGVLLIYNLLLNISSVHVAACSFQTFISCDLFSHDHLLTLLSFFIVVRLEITV